MRRWPRISASSRTPPSEMRTNLRFIDARDRLPERRLADAGRPDEAEDGTLHVPLQLADGQVFDDALLDLVEIVVILVEHAARFDRIEAILGALRPRAPRAASRGRCGSSGTRAPPAVIRSSRSTSRLATAATCSGRFASAIRLRSSCDLAVRPRRAPTGSPSSAGAARTAAARRSFPFRRATRSVPSARGRRSRAPAPSATASSLIEMLFSSSSRCLSSGFMSSRLASR